MTKLSWKAAGVALVVASCEHTERFDASPPAERAARQEMIVAAGADEFGLRLNQNRLGMYPLNATICEPLVRLTKDFQIEPWLASRWEYRGSNTYRFTLRRGVGFHDGRPLDAASVALTASGTHCRVRERTFDRVYLRGSATAMTDGALRMRARKEAAKITGRDCPALSYICSYLSPLPISNRNSET
jgi:hypothetical protein